MAKVNTRIQSKHDVEKNWANATFAPLPGEIIIYDKDKGGAFARLSNTSINSVGGRELHHPVCGISSIVAR